MICYALKCSRDHRFDSWFQSAAAFDRLAVAGHLACAVCGDGDVGKVLMAPAVRPARTAAVPPAEIRPGAGQGGSGPSLAGGAPTAGAASGQPGPSLALPTTELEKAIADLRRKVEQNSDYVGNNFAAEARAIHEGDAPERAIWGEARPEEARALLEDGIRVAPLPFLPTRKAH